MALCGCVPFSCVLTLFAAVELCVSALLFAAGCSCCLFLVSPTTLSCFRLCFFLCVCSRVVLCVLHRISRT